LTSIRLVPGFLPSEEGKDPLPTKGNSTKATRNQELHNHAAGTGIHITDTTLDH
jgi:hypothetical protein